MKDKRQGNDLKVAWSIFMQDGEPFRLDGKDVSLYLKNMFGRKELNDFVTTGNIIQWTFYGKDQKNSGKYSLELVINEGEKGMITTDKCDFVNLVSCSCKLQGGEDAPNVETESIELTSTLEYVSGGGSYDDTALWKELENKVDKVEGLGLSEENYTTEEKDKLAGLQNYDDTKLKEEIAETYATKEYVDEAVANAEGSGEGCECATPDWSAPEGKEGHILNRTHYKDAITSQIGKFSYKIEWDGQNLIRVPFVDGGYIDAHIDTDVLMDYTPDPGLEGTYIGSVAFDDDYDACLDLYGGDGDGYDIEIRASDKYDGAIDIDSLAFISFSIKTLGEEYIPDTIARKQELTELSAEVSGLSEEMANKQDVYVAEYGVTTREQIKAAWEANKHIVCVYGNKLYNLANYGDVYDIYFACVYYSVELLMLSVAGNWSRKTLDFEGQSNKVKTINEASTDTQYPSAKAVYDFVNSALGTIINGDY